MHFRVFTSLSLHSILLLSSLEVAFANPESIDAVTVDLPPASNPTEFCAHIVSDFGAKLDKKSQEAVMPALMTLLGGMAKRQTQNGSIRPLKDRQISEAAMKGLLKIQQLLVEGKIFNPSELAQVAFKAELERIQREKKLLVDQLHEVAVQSVNSGSLSGAGALPPAHGQLNRAIDELEALEKRIQNLSPIEASSIFLASLGATDAVNRAIDVAQEREEAQLQAKRNLQLSFKKVIRDMVNHLHKKWVKGKLGKGATEQIDRIRGEIKASPEKFQAKREDLLMLGDLFKEHLIFWHWGLGTKHTDLAANEALVRFLTTDGPIELDADGNLPPLTNLQRALYANIVVKATDIDNIEMNRLYVESTDQERNKLALLKSALSQVTSGVPLALESKNRVVLAERLAISEALLDYYNAAARFSHSHDEAVASLVGWLIAGRESEITKDQIKALRASISATIPIARKLLKRESRARFYRFSFKSALVLSLLGVSASTLSEGLDYSGIYQEAPSWEEQLFLAKTYGNQVLNWSDAQVDALMDAAGVAYDKVEEGVKSVLPPSSSQQKP